MTTQTQTNTDQYLTWFLKAGDLRQDYKADTKVYNNLNDLGIMDLKSLITVRGLN